jgi:hypothetical protein
MGFHCYPMRFKKIYIKLTYFQFQIIRWKMRTPQGPHLEVLWPVNNNFFCLILFYYLTLIFFLFTVGESSQNSDSSKNLSQTNALRALIEMGHCCQVKELQFPHFEKLVTFCKDKLSLKSEAGFEMVIFSWLK